jgi:hypothetical protein
MPRISSLLLAVVLTPLASTAQKPNPTSPAPIFSEDFESGAINKSLWTQDITGDAILTVQSGKAAHGKYALLVRSPAPAMRTHAFLIARNLPAALAHHHFGRAYVFITPSVPDRHTVFITAGATAFPHSRFFEIATSHANFQTTFTDQVDSAEDWHPGPTVPLNRWFLLEWEFNDQPDQETLWVDGQRIMDSPFTYKSATQSTGLIGAFTDFSVGFLLRGAAPVPFDIYYDDIALDTHRLGPVTSSHETDQR